MASGGATISGLASGIQWRDMLDQIAQMETATRVAPVKSQVAATQKQIEGLNRYKGLVTALSTAAKAFSDGSALGKFSVSATPSPTGKTLLTATAGAAASPGSYEVEVVSLARAGMLALAQQTSDTGALGTSGSLSINGKTIAVDGADSLNALRDHINSTDGVGVTAAVLKVDTGKYVLTLTSKTPGSAPIDYADATGALAVQSQVSGADAEVWINGVQVRRQSNSLDDVIPGVTLNLQQAEPGAKLQVEVAADQQPLVDAAKAFVKAFNDIRAYYDQQNGASAIAQPLARSPLLRTSLNAFKGLVLGSSGDASLTSYKSLGGLGISLGKDGFLQLDEGKLKDAFADKPGEVKALLAEAGAGFVAAAEPFTREQTGSIATQIRTANERVTSLNRRADTIQERIDAQMARMSMEYVRMEQAMAAIQSTSSWLGGQISSLLTN